MDLKGEDKRYFNSLQVDSKRQIINRESENYAAFQFLIGRLKTGFALFTLLRYFGFQFLIGRLKTAVFLSEITAYDLISIPYRQTQNKTSGGQVSPSCAISIPYRQTQNDDFYDSTGYRHREFQFLIGRLKTPAANPLRSVRADFNSLQVDSKQNHGHKKENFNHVFQFLIGRLKTDQLFDCVLSCHISIPYRQTQNYH